MDPVTLITTALTAGAVASLKDTTSAAVKDAYNGLKALIQRKFAEKSTAQLIVSEYEKKPEVWQLPLVEEIKQSGIEQDQEIIAAAQRLLAQLHPQQAAMGKYNIQVTGPVQGLAMGDSQQVTMHFGKEPLE